MLTSKQKTLVNFLFRGIGLLLEEAGNRDHLAAVLDIDPGLTLGVEAVTHLGEALVAVAQGIQDAGLASIKLISDILDLVANN